MLVAAVTASAAVWLYYYTRFSREIEARLQVRPPLASAVYSRSLPFRRGQKVSSEELQDRLFRLGYARVASAREVQGREEWFLAEAPDRLLIGQTRRGRPERIGIGFAADSQGRQRIVAISQEGRPVPQARLKEQFLSSLYGSDREKRQRVRFEDLPDHLVDAVLAAEDAEFFTHAGLDFWGILRAFVVNLTRMEAAQGGSTLTQQFVKNFFLTPRKSLKRKFEEMFLAVLLERRFSKKEIFQLYANDVYLGQSGTFAVKGFGQGATVFFGKDVRSLSLAESALMAGIVQAPNRYSPVRRQEQAVRRREYVLAQMHSQGMITAEELRQAAQESPRIASPFRSEIASAPYFVDFLNTQLEEVEAIERRDFSRLEVYSTLDPELQRIAYESVLSGLQRIDGLRPGKPGEGRPQAALIAADPRSGEILAMIGGRAYSESQFNRAVRALRQPGSTFKPFVYAAALSRRNPSTGQPEWTLSSQLLDEPTTFLHEGRRYSPGNYGGRYRGRVSLRQSLALSLNVPTVKLAESIEYRSVAELARKLGIRRPLRAYPSLALGTFELSLLELVRGYTAFANQGRTTPLRTLLSVEADGRPAAAPSPSGNPTLQPEVAYLVTSALSSAMSFGTGKSARRKGFDAPSAGKTGSTDDAWFIGYTPELICGVWVGYDDSRPLDLSGGQAALPIWTEFMSAARRIGRLSGLDFDRPKGIVGVAIDRGSGLRAAPACRGQVYTEYYIEGSQPLRTCSEHGESPPSR